MKDFHLVLGRICARATLATIALSISTTQISGSVMLVTASVLSDTRHMDITLSVLLLFWEDIWLRLVARHLQINLTILTTDHNRALNFAWFSHQSRNELLIMWTESSGVARVTGNGTLGFSGVNMLRHYSSPTILGDLNRTSTTRS